MITFVLIFLALEFAGFLYMFFIAIFTPELKKSIAYAKLKAKERDELDKRLDVEHYLGAKVENDIELPKVKIIDFFKKKK